MLLAISGLKRCEVAATDGVVGTAKDFLFDDQNWQVRWMVVDTGHWLPGRKLLIHPTAIAPLELPRPSEDALPQMRMGPEVTLTIPLTREQIEASPDVSADEPVSAQLQHRVSEYFGWASRWGASSFGANAIAAAVSPPPLFPDGESPDTDAAEAAQQGDPHLRSAAAVIGYHVHATDGEIGHVEDFLVHQDHWQIRYLIVATRNWWPGKHVLLAPFAVVDIDWYGRQVTLNVTRDQVQSSPPWQPAAAVAQINEEQLHGHYGWPGYDI